MPKHIEKHGAYQRRRDFSNTPEPHGTIKISGRKDKKRRFVVQRHDATTLHFDFRLEAGGVLKSWAVPKGPPQDPGDKRLAIMVEDHPLAYAKFQGTIPEGNYGAGEVKIWDQGWYLPEGSAIDSSIRKGELKFALHGRKLKGRYMLTKFKGEGENQWLLIKLKDVLSKDN